MQVINSPMNAAGGRLQPDSRGACVRVDEGIICQNAATLKKKLTPGTLMMAVVKANAYGHGIISSACAALKGGADWLGVAIPEEGAVLRENGVQAPCLVLGNVTAQGAYISVEKDLTQTVCDVQGVQLLQEACDRMGKCVHVHLKLDTGMGRIGARTKTEIQDILSALAVCTSVQLTGVFTHFAEAENEASARGQYIRFLRLIEGLPQGLIRHATASAAALRYPEMHLDMVRMGIALYGCECDYTEPAMQWETRVVYVKDVEPGEKISYGGTFMAEKYMRVATVAVGYGDGYARACSGKASMLIRGQRCRVLGRVCMDQTIVDVTQVPQVRAGDVAVLLGAQQNERITAEELAGWADTISYEVLMWHSGRVPVAVENKG